MKKTIYFSILISMMAFMLSCSDNNEDAPPVISFSYGETVTVQQVKALYDSQLAISDYKLRIPVEVTEDWALKGIITASDKTDGNLYKEAYVEDATGGLRIVLNSTGGLSIGDSVIINVKGLFISDYGNFWQLGDQPYHESDGDVRVAGIDMDERILKTSVNNLTKPDTATITEIKTTAYLGRLVTLKDVQFTDEMAGLTWADAVKLLTMNRDLKDCNNKTIIVRTSGYCRYAGELLPTGKGTITGIVTIYNGTYQFIVRDFTEVAMTGTRCGVVEQPLGTPVETLSEDFEIFVNDQTIYINGWQNIAQVGGRLWLNKVFSGNSYAQATAYGSGLSNMVTWLITRPVTISTQKVLTFQSEQAYWAHSGSNAPMQLLFSTDYNGTNLLTATWTPLSAVLADKDDAANTWISSGNVSLPLAAGKSGVIAFKYTGSSTESTSYRIDNILVTAAK